MDNSKNEILGQNYRQIAAKDFYDMVFGRSEQTYVVMLADAKSNNKHKIGTYKKINGFDALMDIASSRSDAYVPPASFLQNCYKQKMLNKLFAFVIDLDEINASIIEWLIKKIENQRALLPTAIVNSGNGLHFYYILAEPVECYAHRHETMKKIKQALEESWRSTLYKVDKSLTLIQSFRVVGSLDKNGNLVKAFLSGEKFSIKEIADYFKIGLWPGGGSGKQARKARADSADERRDVVPNGGKPFYKHCYWRVGDEVEIGHRYKALFALAIVGYKCGVPFAKVQDDIDGFFHLFNGWAPPGKELRRDEADKALQGYSQKFVLTSSEVLEAYFGFKFPRKSKHNGRKQKEHLAMMKELSKAAIKKRSIERAEKIALLWQQGLTKRKIAEQVGIALTNLYKNYGHLLRNPPE